MTRILIVISGCFFISVSLAGCEHTFDGAGKDIEKTGEWIQETF